MNSFKQSKCEIREGLEGELYDLQSELEEAEAEHYMWETRVKSLKEEKESLADKINKL